MEVGVNTEYLQIKYGTFTDLMYVAIFVSALSLMCSVLLKRCCCLLEIPQVLREIYSNLRKKYIK